MYVKSAACLRLADKTFMPTHDSCFVKGHGFPKSRVNEQDCAVDVMRALNIRNK